MNYSILKSNDKIEDIIFYLSVVFLFIYGLMSPLFDLQLLNILLCAFCFAIAFVRRQLSVDIGFILIFITYLLVANMDLHGGDTSTTVFVTLLPFAYMLGKLIAPRDKFYRDERLFIIIFALALGMFLQGMLNYYNGPLYKTPDLSGAWTEFWTGKEDVSRNIFDFSFVYMTSFFPIIFILFLLKKNRAFAIALLVFNIIVEACTVFIGKGRSNFCYMVVSTAVIFFIYFLTNFKWLSEKAKKKVYIACVTLLFLAVLLILLVKLNAFGLHDIYSDSFLNRDGGILHNIRFEIDKESIALMLAQPLGGWEVTYWSTALGLGFTNAHNSWLLFAQNYDLIVFSLMMMTKLLFIKDTILIAIDKNKKTVDYLLCSLFLNVNLYFSMDTFPYRYKQYWIFLLIVSGFIRGRLEQKENKLIFPTTIKEYYKGINI